MKKSWLVPCLGFLGSLSAVVTALKLRNGPNSATSAAATSAKLSKLAAVAKSLSALEATQKTELGKTILQPFVAQVKALLAHKDQKDTDQKSAGAVEKQADALTLSLVHRLQQRGGELLRDQQKQKIDLLLGVLLSRKAAPLAEQYEVLADSQFKELPVVKSVLGKKGSDDRALVEQCGEFLDSHPTSNNLLEASEGSEAEPSDKKDEAGKDEKEASANEVGEKSTKEAGSAEYKEKVEKQIEEETKKQEQKALNERLVVRRKKNPPAQGNDQKEMVVRMLEQKIMGMVKRLEEARESGEMTHAEIAGAAKNIKVMQKALKAVKENDAQSLQEAQEELIKSMHDMQRMASAASDPIPFEDLGEAPTIDVQHPAGQGIPGVSADGDGVGEPMEDQGAALPPPAEESPEQPPEQEILEVYEESKDNLALLQQSAVAQSATAKDCPYCKAQCFEKCHDSGNTYVRCLSTCAEVGN
ncbi:unnamed protein product [Amoebophrya sp. A25]|nr:unnamed protein product [Amoebophrya sp. A25]|eukprot:GSA25T00018635001.1